MITYPVFRRWRRQLLVLTVLTVLLVGISRVYLGVHYPSDVLVGFAAEGTWATICSFMIRTWNQHRHAKT